MSKFPFIGGSYQSRSVNFDAQRTIGLYPEASESGSSKNVGALYGTPGTKLFASLPTQPVRGLWAGEFRMFAAGGSRLYEVFADGSFFDRGDIGNDGLPVQMFPNGNQLAIISAGLFYIDNGAGAVAAQFSPPFTDLVIGPGANQVTSVGSPFGLGDLAMFLKITGGVGFTVGVYHIIAVDPVTGVATLNNAVGVVGSVAGIGAELVSAAQGAFLDGYYIAAPRDSKLFFLSALLDGSTWDHLDFATKEGYPDNIAAILADHEEIWLFGDEATSEVWRNTGDPDFPFQRDPGAFIHYGCMADFTPTRLNNGVAWIGGDEQRGAPVAWYAQGYLPIRISTHAVELAWSKYHIFSDAVAYAYIDNGHHFWVINFPSGNATWCYDASTNLWHERGWWNGASLDRQRQWVHCFVPLAAHGAVAQFVPPAHYVGDWQNGNIYTMSTAYLDDNGTPILRQRTCPHISEEQKWAFYHRFQLDMATGLGANPTMTLDWSDDGGHTFGNAIQASAGALGAFKQRVIWNRLGRSRDRVFRVTTMDASEQAWINAYLEVELGTN